MKMSDLQVEVPLAALDDEDDADLNEIQGGITTTSPISVSTTNSVGSSLDNQNNNPATAMNGSSFSDDSAFCDSSVNSKSMMTNFNNSSNSPDIETFSETFSGSLEDLVGHFDEKITRCLKNFTESTETLAPVQVRTQEEIMNESQIWWTLTGNYGNILPIDWSKSYTRNLQLPALHLRSKKNSDESTDKCLDVSDDEELAHALDLHSLIATSLANNHEPPPQTAEQVIEEIDEIMEQSYNSELTASSDYTMESVDSSINSPLKSPLPQMQQYTLQRPDVESRVRDAASLTANPDKLNKLSLKKLSTLHGELDSLIQIYNETLVQELALRDELEYEKELKNTFISLILNIQNKRRQFHIDKKRKSNNNKSSTLLFFNGTPTNGGTASAVQNLPQYLTIVIPFRDGCGSLDNHCLQVLIKILRAVIDDNPNVPTMLTDYILNVLCPSSAVVANC